MRQQLRLNVLIPVAVLGLLGAGFGAYAMGGAPGPGATPAPVTTTAPTAPAVPAAPAKQPKPGAVTAEAWATGANELCSKAGLEAQVVGKPLTRKELVQTYARINKFYAYFNPRLAALGWPQGKKGAVLELQGEYRRTARAFRRAHQALRVRNYLGATKILEKAAENDYNDRKAFRRLGATVCATHAAKAINEAQATDSLQWMLLRYRTVVVVFYSPESTVDGAVVIEARAAALDAGAGFVAVNVKRESQVAALAIGYEVLDTPSVLVFTRGPRLRSHFSGIVDRVTVAQAVTNARQ